jgi:hypothetical protein
MKYLMLIFLTILFSCYEAEPIEESEKVIFFQFEYINYAWGYNHTGFIIDQDGNIYDYNQPEGWNFPNDDQISLSDFQKNLDSSEVRLSSIDGEEFQRMLTLAPKVMGNNLTEMKNVMNDAGAELYNVYIANKNKTTLTRYLLQMRGDNYQKNTNPASDEITNFLIGIRDKDGFSDEHF